MARRRIWMAGALLVPGLMLWHPAAARAEPPLRLADVVAQARERNPGLEAARERAKAMGAVPAQVSAYDDPTLSYEAWNIPDSLNIDQADNNIFRLSQKIPFPGKRRLAGEVAQHEADQASREVEEGELGLVAAVKRAYFELWGAHARLRVVERERDLMQRFTHIAEQRYAVGESQQVEVLRAQVELTHLINQVQTQQLEIDTARADLNALLSRPPQSPLGVPANPEPPSLAESAARLAALAAEKRPQIAAGEAGIAREESAVDLAERNRLPDFEFSVGRFVNFDAPDGFGANVSVTLPFLNPGKYDAGVLEATSRLAAAKAEKRRIEDRVQRQVVQAYLRARTALLQYDLLTRTHVPQVEQALRVSESGYQTGAVGFLDLMDTLRRLEAIHLEHVQALADFEIARAELERVVGVELPHE